MERSGKGGGGREVNYMGEGGEDAALSLARAVTRAPGLPGLAAHRRQLLQAAAFQTALHHAATTPRRASPVFPACQTHQLCHQRVPCTAQTRSDYQTTRNRRWAHTFGG